MDPTVAAPSYVAMTLSQLFPGLFLHIPNMETIQNKFEENARDTLRMLNENYTTFWKILVIVQEERGSSFVRNFP